MIFLTIAFIHLCALVLPGPDFLLVSQTSLSRGRKAGMYAACGIAAGIIIWAALALLGLNFLLQKWIWLHNIIVCGGGLYLCWMGIQLLRSFRQPEDWHVTATAAPKQAALWPVFVKGVLTNLANPKAVVYFGSIFSLFLSKPELADRHLLLLALIGAESLAWFALIVVALSSQRSRSIYAKIRRWLDGLCGGLFVGLGLYLITERK